MHNRSAGGGKGSNTKWDDDYDDSNNSDKTTDSEDLDGKKFKVRTGRPHKVIFMGKIQHRSNSASGMSTETG